MIFDSFTRSAEVRRVIDGDTIEVMVDMGFKRYSIERLRLLGVDTPEMRGDQRELGLLSKMFVEDKFLNNKNIVIQSEKGDAFGRWLADVYYTDNNGQQIYLNNELIEKGFAVPY